MDPLEFLAQSNQCLISDLRYCDPARHDLTMLLQCASEDFTVSGWNALLQYIFPGAPLFQTQQDARTYLEFRWVQKQDRPARRG